MSLERENIHKINTSVWDSWHLANQREHIQHKKDIQKVQVCGKHSGHKYLCLCENNWQTTVVSYQYMSVSRPQTCTLRSD